MAVFACPQCAHAQVVDDDHIGKNATCPKCKTEGPVNKTVADDSLIEQHCSEMSIRKADNVQVGVSQMLHGGGLGPPDATSLLWLEWIIVDDPRLPVAFVRVEGVRAIRDTVKDRYWYYANFDLRLTEDSVTAWESRFLTFNVWGDHVRTLSYTNVNRNKMALASGSWYLGSETEGNMHIASIGYIARVRTREGKVLHADTEFILREAKRFSEKFTEEDLEPKSPKKE